jgi:hypothetical protein
MGGILTAFIGVWGMLNAAVIAAFSPIGLSIIIVTALGAAFLYTSKTVRDSASAISSSLGAIASEAGLMIGIVSELFLAGDVVTAVGVLWAFIQKTFAQGWSALKVLTLQGVQKLAMAWAELGVQAAIVWVDIVAAIDLAWESIKTSATAAGLYILKAFISVGDGISQVFWKVLGAIAEAVGSTVQDIAGATVELFALLHIIDRDTASKAQDRIDRIKALTTGAAKGQEEKARGFYREKDKEIEAGIEKNTSDFEAQKLKLETARKAEVLQPRKDDTTQPLFLSEIAAAQAESAKAQSDYQAALAKGRDALTASEGQLPDSVTINREAIGKKLSAGLEAAIGATSTAGTFGGASIAQVLGGDDSAKRTADNTGQMVAKQKDTNNLLQDLTEELSFS